MASDVKVRVLTGFIGGLALLGLILLGGSIGIFLFSTLLSLGMVFEFSSMIFSLPDRIEKQYLMLLIVWLVAIFNVLFPQTEFHLLVFSFLGLFTYFLFSAKRYLSGDPAFELHFRELMFSVFGLVYVGFIPIYFRKIYDLGNGVKWTVLFLLIVWAGDSIAYFAGRKFGKTKLYPLISPNKTIEGALGGLAGGVIVSVLFRLAFLRGSSWFEVVILAILVGMTAQVGDLCESFLKRAFAKKDSGSLLPGHGGLLDRFDGVVFGLPVMYACIRILS